MNGSIKHIRKEKNFTQIDNELLDNGNLSLAEKGMLVCLLRLPESWDLKKYSLPKRLNEKSGTIDRIWKSLMDKGYIERIPLRNEKGQLVGYQNLVYESLSLRTPGHENTGPGEIRVYSNTKNLVIANSTSHTKQEA